MHEIQIKFLKLARSSSTRARNRWSPDSFLNFFAILVNTTAERVSFIKIGINAAYTIVTLRQADDMVSIDGIRAEERKGETHVTL